MATHSSVLAWRIPWTEKSGRLQSMGLHRVGQILVTASKLLVAACRILSFPTRDRILTPYFGSAESSNIVNFWNLGKTLISNFLYEIERMLQSKAFRNNWSWGMIQS